MYHGDFTLHLTCTYVYVECWRVYDTSLKLHKTIYIIIIVLYNNRWLKVRIKFLTSLEEVRCVKFDIKGTGQGYMHALGMVSKW